MKKSAPVNIHRVTHFPTANNTDANSPANVNGHPESVWIALGVNTQEVVAQNTDKTLLIQELERLKFVVKQTFNEWN